MVFKNRCILVLWTNVASALVGLINRQTGIKDIQESSNHAFCKTCVKNVSLVTESCDSLIRSDICDGFRGQNDCLVVECVYGIWCRTVILEGMLDPEDYIHCPLPFSWYCQLTKPTGHESFLYTLKLRLYTVGMTITALFSGFYAIYLIYQQKSHFDFIPKCDVFVMLK